MADPLIFVDRSVIHEGKRDAVEKAIAALVDFVESTEPRPLAYRVYLDEGGTHMTVVQIHPDSASMAHHMSAAAPAFRRFVGLITLETMDIYGRPSDDVLEQLRQKVEMLGTARLAVHDLHAGFVRFREATATSNV